MTRIKLSIAEQHPTCITCGAPMTRRGNKHLVYDCGATLDIRRMVWDTDCSRTVAVLTNRIKELAKQLRGTVKE
jgi:hypothetical protein